MKLGVGVCGVLEAGGFAEVGLNTEASITSDITEFTKLALDGKVGVYAVAGPFSVEKTILNGADTLLSVGEENVADEKLNINVISSFEGLEAGTVNCYSGNVMVEASDDGINAAGGSSNGTDLGSGRDHNFNRPGMGGQPGQTTSTGDYSINIYGGNVYVNSDGDGLDSNGAITISDGVVVVFGAAARSDNAPYDCESQFTITGGTVFGAGSSQMAVTPTGTQKYITSRTSIAQGKNIVVSDSSSNVLFVAEGCKDVNYVMYSSPELVNGGSYTISATSEDVVMPTATPTPEPTAIPTVEPTPTPDVQVGNGQTSEESQTSASTTDQNLTEQSQSAVSNVGKTFTRGNLNYKIVDSVSVELTGGKNKKITKLVIPSTVTYNGTTYKVKSISKNAFSGYKKLTTVKTGTSVNVIGSKAFYNCPKLKTVSLGKNVTTIGANAFSKCTSLKKIVLPSKVSSIGKQAFSGCKKLQSITIKSSKLTSKTIGTKAFSSISKNAVVKVPKNKLKSYKSFLYQKGLQKSVTITKY